MNATIQNYNYELDEATATAVAIILHNHMEVLRVWERKMRTPYMPTTRRHFSVVPDYPKPRVVSVLHIINAMKRFELELTQLAVKFMMEEKIKAEG